MLKILVLLTFLGDDAKRNELQTSSKLVLDTNLVGKMLETPESEALQNFKFCSGTTENRDYYRRYLKNTSYRIIIAEEVAKKIQKERPNNDYNILLLSVILITLMILFTVNRRLACNQVKIVSKITTYTRTLAKSETAHSAIVTAFSSRSRHVFTKY